MPGKINVYNLGQKGVNVVKSPVHLDDGELTSAQNVQISQIGSGGGIRKRDGLAKLNAVALAGAGRGMINLPLPDRSNYVRRFFLPFDDRSVGANYFITSTDGTTWTPSKTYGSQPWQSDKLGAAPAIDSDVTFRYAVHRNKFYYVGNDYSASSGAATIHMIDGDTGTDYLLASVPRNPRTPASTTHSILNITAYSSTYLIVTTCDDTTAPGRGRVFLLNVTNGQLTQIGQETDLSSGFPSHVIVFGGRIYVGTTNTSGGAAATARWARLGDTTWTTDLTTGATRGYISGFAAFKGLLYVGTECDAGSVASIYQRSAAGAWAVVDSTNGTAAGQCYGGFAVAQDGGTLYAFYDSVDGAGNKMRIRKTTDGAAWSDEVTLSAASSAGFGSAGQAVVDSNGDIYWPFGSRNRVSTGHIMKRAVGGGWTDVYSASAAISSALVALKMAS